MNGAFWKSIEHIANGVPELNNVVALITITHTHVHTHMHTHTHTHTHAMPSFLLELLWTLWAPGSLQFMHEMVHRDNFCSNKHHDIPFPTPIESTHVVCSLVTSAITTLLPG